MARIYTRLGDHGTTSLPKGTIVSKGSPIIEALSELDACNASIGMALALMGSHSFQNCQDQLHQIQNWLYDLSDALSSQELTKFNKNLETSRIAKLENWIDAMDTVLPPTQASILPGGSTPASALYVARGCCRKLEVQLVRLGPKEGLAFLNRLSDYLFIAARFANQQLSHKDTERIIT